MAVLVNPIRQLAGPGQSFMFSPWPVGDAGHGLVGEIGGERLVSLGGGVRSTAGKHFDEG